MLEQFDIGALEPNTAAHLHLFIEAKKLAYEDRAQYFADPAFAEIPVEALISKDYAMQRASLIDPERARDDFSYGDPQLDSDTVYLCAADSDGNMISLIQSIFRPWGSGIVPKGLGFAMQNRGQSFALDPGHRNRLEGHKRPFHTIIPAFLTRDGRPVMAFGVMGGPFQPQGHTQVLMNMIDFEMSVQQAGEQPRISHIGSSTPEGAPMRGGGELVIEHGLPDSTQRDLQALGHRISDQTDAHGGYQAIWREDNPRRYFGGSDPRKDGSACGY
jgi:gamma-glutamyltranspeptidase/glutathione hydrolase